MTAAPIQPVESSAGWRARIDLRFVRSGGQTRIRREAGHGPLCVQKPFYPEGDLCHVYLLHPPGGVAGGDNLSVNFATEPGAAALITTPAASKFYRSSGAQADLTQTMTVAAESSLEWLPQETLFFGGCRVTLDSRIRLAPGARFIGWETLCLGREASGDDFSSGTAVVGLTFSRCGNQDSSDQILLRERLPLVAGDRMLAAPWGLAGRRVLATLHATPVDRDVLRLFQREHEALTRSSDLLSAVTVVDDLLIYRVLGQRSEAVRAELTRAWQTLRPLVLGRAACPPRIWST